MADFFGIDQIVKDGITHGKQVLKEAGHHYVREFIAPDEMNRSFIHIRDFYNFIRSSSANIPAPFFYFCPNFYAYSTSVDMNTSVTVSHGKAVTESQKNLRTDGEFFNEYLAEFARFRYCIQAISFPMLQITSFNDGNGGNGSMAVRDISNIYGGHVILNNSYLNAAQHTLEMNILNTHKPVVENFIYPWMLEALNTDIIDRPIPRVNMAVKYWNPGRITRNMEGVPPDFVYYVTGLFPVKIDTWNPKQTSGGDSDIQRKVTFAFNDFVILNSYSDALKYNLIEFFVHNAVDNAIRKGQQWIDRKIDEWVDKLGKKKKNKDKKKKEKPDYNCDGQAGSCPNMGATDDDKSSSKPENPSSQQKSSDSNDTSDKNTSKDFGLPDATSKTISSVSKSIPTTLSSSQKAPRTVSNVNRNASSVEPTSTKPVMTVAGVSPNEEDRPSVESRYVKPPVEESSEHQLVEEINLDEPATVEKNERADSSNMSLDENIQMFNILNADQEFPEILDADDEADHAISSSDIKSLKRTMTAVDPDKNSNDTSSLLHDTLIDPVNTARQQMKTKKDIDVNAVDHKVTASTKSSPQIHRNLLNDYSSTPVKQAVTKSTSAKLPEDYKNVEKVPTVKRTDPLVLNNSTDYSNHSTSIGRIIPESEKTDLSNVKEHNGSTNVERHQDASKNVQVNPMDVDFKVSSKKPVTATDVNYQIDKSRLSHYISPESLRQIRPSDGDTAVDTKAYKDAVMTKTGVTSNEAPLNKDVFQDLMVSRRNC